MQAAPLQSPPSTGLCHYSAASKHVSDGWDDDNDARVLEWAETCSQGTHAYTHVCLPTHLMFLSHEQTAAQHVLVPQELVF